MIIDFLINTFGCPNDLLTELLVIAGSIFGPFLPILLVIGIEKLHTKNTQHKKRLKFDSDIVFGSLTIIWIIYACYCFMSLQAWLGTCAEIG